jgi:hypothetical protein
MFALLDKATTEKTPRLSHFEKKQRHSRAVAKRTQKQRAKKHRRRRFRHSHRHRELTSIPSRASPGRDVFLHQPPPAPVITVPEELDFLTKPEDALSFFDKLQKTVTKGGHRAVIIDHSALRKMSPEAALVLIAEMSKAHNAAPRCLKQCVFPEDVGTRDLLGLVGYYRYFPKIFWKRPPLLATHFLEHERGTQVEGDVVGKIIELFQPVSHLDDDGNALLYNALGECMNNVLEHAYPEAEHNPDAYRFWWLLAYRDMQTSTISFCFYDQGEGIPSTIRTRFLDKVWLLAPTDSELIQKAVLVGGYSSTRKKSKGRGLPALRKFIESAADGELVIFSRHSRVVFHSHCPPRGAEFSLPLRGSLITWNIRTDDLGPNANNND